MWFSSAVFFYLYSTLRSILKSSALFWKYDCFLHLFFPVERVQEGSVLFSSCSECMKCLPLSTRSSATATVTSPDTTVHNLWGLHKGYVDKITSLLLLWGVRISFLRHQSLSCIFYSTFLITGYFMFSVEIYMERH